MDAVAYMHSQNIAHRDIKLENILIDTSERIKIIDFGFSVSFRNKNNKLKVRCGTPCYMAPEFLVTNIKKLSYDPCAVDVWALGVLLFRILVGTYPFTGFKII